ncbi:hypothetical protein [Acinetobacter sp. 'aerobic (ED)']|uniref:hypothetical protein n=1 Tax=Acinetobacter sp. 'aerobic (ED)' TaxID=174230 RepID=UPI00192B64EE|nr:hypothetical protein [Acinetobacter sp. 'aerobic (ED)']
MSAIYTEEDVLSIIAEGEMDANDLLNSIDPKFARRFKRLNTDLSKLMDEVRRTFPDANYYVEDDQMLLLLGDSHADGYGQASQQQLVAVDSEALRGQISGGGW